MAFNDALLVIGANAMSSAITHVQLHNGAPGAGAAANAVGTRVVPTKSTDADGDITITGAFTGLTANQAITHMSYWSAATGGTNYGFTALTSGDTSANAAGAVTATVVETSTAS